MFKEHWKSKFICKLQKTVFKGIQETLRKIYMMKSHFTKLGSYFFFWIVCTSLNKGFDALLIYKPVINTCITGWNVKEGKSKGNRSFLILKWCFPKSTFGKMKYNFQFILERLNNFPMCFYQMMNRKSFLNIDFQIIVIQKL